MYTEIKINTKIKTHKYINYNIKQTKDKFQILGNITQKKKAQ